MKGNSRTGLYLGAQVADVADLEKLVEVVVGNHAQVGDGRPRLGCEGVDVAAGQRETEGARRRRQRDLRSAPMSRSIPSVSSSNSSAG